MKKIFSKILAMLIVLVTCVSLSTLTVRADGAVYVSVSSGNVEPGQNVTVSVTVSGDNISAYLLYISYDSNILSFNSGSGAIIGGGGGTIKISGTGAGTATLSFTAVGTGSTGIYSSGGEFLDIEANVINVSYGSASVTVGKKEDKPVTTTEADTRSSNNYLSSLSVSKGTLEPEFDPSTTSYKLRLDEDVTSVEVTAYASDSKAKVGISGNTDLKPGVNYITVTVTAENQYTRNYEIKALVGEVLEEEIITVDGVDYNLVTDPAELEDLEDFTVPEGYEQASSKYGKWDILTYKSKSEIALVCLKDEEGNLGWFRYDEETQTFSKYVEFSMSAGRYVLLNIPQDYTNIKGYTLTELTVNETTITALVSEELGENYYIIYAANVMGGKGFYLFDAVENSMIRYTVSTQTDAVEEATISDATASDAIAEEDDTEDKMLTKMQLIIACAAAGALILILLIMVIAFAVRIHGLKQYEYEDDYQEDESDIEENATEEIAEEKAVAEDATTDTIAEAVAEEAVAEETVAEETVAEETAEETVVEEAAEETVAEEAAEETVAEEAAEENVVEEAVAEEAAEDTVAEETVTEEVADKAIAEDTATENASHVKKKSSFEISDAEEDISASIQSEADKEQYENLAKEIEEKIKSDYDASQDSAF